MKNTGKQKQYVASHTDQRKKPQTSTNQVDQHIKDEKYAEDKIISKLMKKGFESLSIEELAVTLISPTFEIEYQNQSGKEWPKENKSKAIERLNFAKFNIQWNASMNKKSTSGMMKSPYGVLFDLCERGDIQRVTEFFKKNAQYMDEIINTVDTNKKSLLHTTAKAGHTNLLLVLLSRGFSVHFRDKFLRTPLHVACQFGRETCVDELIKKSSDIYARDSIGRTSLHYSSCSDSLGVVNLLLGIDPDLVHSKDTYGRTSLHYAVWNATSAQPQICLALLQAKSEVDAIDEEGMTPLHFASDAGKGKVIPILLKFGANPFIRDGRTNRTAIELALTDRIREMIIVYSNKDYQPNNEDKEQLKLEGEKINLTDAKMYSQSQEEQNRLSKTQQMKTSSKGLKPKSTVNVNNDYGDNQLNSLLFASMKEKLVSNMKNIQDYGAKTMQHLSKPEMYSGSWLEKVNNVDDLFRYLNTLTPTEAVISVFNVLSPYSSPLPKGKGNEPDMAVFFNKPQPDSTSQGEGQFLGRTAMEGASPQQTLVYNNQKKEIDSLKEQIELLHGKFDNERSKAESELVNQLKLQIEKNEKENISLKDAAAQLNTKIMSLSKTIQTLENQRAQLANEAKKEKDMEVIELTNQLNQMRNQMTVIQTETDKKKTFNLSETYKNPKAQIPIELSIGEEKSLFVFKKLIETKGFDKLLSRYDKDNDLHILKHDYISLLNEIGLPFEDRAAIIKISGFDSKMMQPIKKLLESVYKHEERKLQKQNELLFTFAYRLGENNKLIEEFYTLIARGCKGKKTINTTELKSIKQGLITPEEIDILFNCWEGSGNGMINIDELCQGINTRKKVIDEISNVNQKVKFEGKTTIKKGANQTSPPRTGIIDNIPEEMPAEKPKHNAQNEYEIPDSEEFIDKNVNISNQQSEHNSQPLDNSLNIDVNQIPSKPPSQYSNNNNMKEEEEKQLSNIIQSPQNNNQSEVNTLKSISSKVMQVGSLNKKPVFNFNEKINGELKVQVKKIDNITLPTTIKPPYSFILSFSLPGIDSEFDSKEVLTDDIKRVVFNWSTRTVLNKITLKALASNCTIVLKTKLNQAVVPLGDCMFNWTCCLNKANWDKFIIDDNFQLLNKKKMPFGYIHIQAKFIPFGTASSNYDSTGKRKAIPVNMEPLVKNAIQVVDRPKPPVKAPVIEEKEQMKEPIISHNEEIVQEKEEKKDDANAQVEDNEVNEEQLKQEGEEENYEQDQEGFDNNQDKVEENNEEEQQEEQKDEQQEEQQEEYEQPQDDINQDNVNEKKEEEEQQQQEQMSNHPSQVEDSGITVIKEIEVEVMNLVDKEKYRNKNYYIALTTVDEELYSSKEEKEWNDIVKTPQFIFNATLYTTDKKKTINLLFSVKSKDTDEEVAAIPLQFNALEKNVTVTNKYELTGPAQKTPIVFYLKITVSTTENDY